MRIRSQIPFNFVKPDGEIPALSVPTFVGRFSHEWTPPNKKPSLSGRVHKVRICAYLAQNPQPELGQFSSLRLGLQAVLERGRDTACVTLVDRPPALPSTLLRVKERFLETCPDTTWAVVPQFNSKHGHPVIFAREMIEVFLRADPASSARDIEHQYQNRIEYVDVDDPRVIMNINTPEDYSALTRAPQTTE